MTRPFIQGLELCELFYREAVAPLLAKRFPTVPHSAARLGGGSDVIGFDTPQSMDHDWGPRLTLFLSTEDHKRLNSEIDQTLSAELPREIHGFPTGFRYHDDGTTWLAEGEPGPVRHQVDIRTVRSFFVDYMNYDPERPLDAVDWLTFPQQRLRTVASGRIFCDGLHQLGPIRERLRYYPRDLWLYLVAVQWRRISQEEAFMARCGDVGDELGSRLIAARMVHELMQLCFLMERQYVPYSKWLGTAFALLGCASRFTPIFEQVLNARLWQEREQHLSAAYEIAVAMHNRLQITDPLSAAVSRFHERPYVVIDADRVATAIRESIADAQVRALPVHLGSVDQFIHSTDVLTSPHRLDQLRAMYR